MKNILYTIGGLFLVIALYYAYQWKVTNNPIHEPSYSIASSIATIILFIIAWRYDGSAVASGNNEAEQTNILSGNNTNKRKGNAGKTKQSNFLSFKNRNENS